MFIVTEYAPLRAKIVLFRKQAWNFPHLLRLVSWWFLDIEPLRQISSAHVQGKIHFRYRKFGLTDYTDQYLRLTW